MSLGLEYLKNRYNEVLSREKKAVAFFDNPSESIEKKEKWLPKYHEITRQLSRMMNAYEAITGTEMKDDEILNGFKKIEM
jgi:hypothetical protein